MQSVRLVTVKQNNLLTSLPCCRLSLAICCNLCDTACSWKMSYFHDIQIVFFVLFSPSLRGKQSPAAAFLSPTLSLIHMAVNRNAAGLWRGLWSRAASLRGTLLRCNADMEDDQIMRGFLSSPVVLGRGWAAKSTVWALLKNQHVEMMFWNCDGPTSTTKQCVLGKWDTPRCLIIDFWCWWVNLERIRLFCCSDRFPLHCFMQHECIRPPNVQLWSLSFFPWTYFMFLSRCAFSVYVVWELNARWGESFTTQLRVVEVNEIARGDILLKWLFSLSFFFFFYSPSVSLQDVYLREELMSTCSPLKKSRRSPLCLWILDRSIKQVSQIICADSSASLLPPPCRVFTLQQL